MGRRGEGSGRARPGFLVDLTPLRRYPAFRQLWLGYLLNTLGSQLTVVAVPYEVFQATHSSLQVGLVSLAQLGGLLLGSLAGGVVADHLDRRRLLLVSQLLLAATSAGLALNAVGEGSLWAIYLCSGAAAALSGVSGSTRAALVVRLVDREAIVSANALWQLLFQISVVIGPSIAGALLGRIGLAPLYGIDAATFLATVVTVLRLPPLGAAEGGGAGISLRSFAEGMRYLRREKVLQATYLIDLNAMVFGMPRALFPALALERYHAGTAVLGLLYAAPGAGALFVAVFTGWATRVRRQGAAVLVAVTIWGGAIAAFGVLRALWAGLLCLAVAGAADVISAIFRGTILQVEAPAELRGRVQGVQFAVVAGGPRLGDVESALVAGGFGLEASVVSGGLACLLGVALLAWRMPVFARYETSLGGPAADVSSESGTHARSREPAGGLAGFGSPPGGDEVVGG